jgi:hypothetical protein
MVTQYVTVCIVIARKSICLRKCYFVVHVRVFTSAVIYYANTWVRESRLVLTPIYVSFIRRAIRAQNNI